MILGLGAPPWASPVAYGPIFPVWRCGIAPPVQFMLVVHAITAAGTIAAAATAPRVPAALLRYAIVMRCAIAMCCCDVQGLHTCGH